MSVGEGHGCDCGGCHRVPGLPACCAFWSHSRSEMHASHLTVGCGWAHSTLPCGRSDRTRVLRGNSSCMFTQCPVLRGTVCPRTQKYAEVVFQKTFSSLPRGHGLAPEPKVCIVFLPQGLATNSTWHLYLQHHRGKQIIWPKWQRPCGCSQSPRPPHPHPRPLMWSIVWAAQPS